MGFNTISGPAGITSGGQPGSLTVGTTDATTLSLESGGQVEIVLASDGSKATLAANKNLDCAAGTTSLDLSLGTGPTKFTTGDVMWPSASGKIFRFGTPGLTDPQIDFATMDGSLNAGIAVTSTTFNGSTDIILQWGRFNLNKAGNYIDATRMGFGYSMEFEYDIGDAVYTGGAITGATNATPIVVTTATPHGLTSNDKVDISGVTGNTAANGTRRAITKTGASTFSINGSVGNGAYVAGGAIVAHRLTLENYGVAQQPGSNNETRPIGWTYNNDGLYGAFASVAGKFTITDTTAAAQRLILPDAASGDVTAQWGASTGGVSHLIGKNNVSALLQTDSAGNSRELLKLDATGAGNGANDILSLAGGVNTVFIGGNVTFLKQTDRTIKINDATDATFSGGALTIQAGKGATSGAGGALNLYAGGSPSGTKGSIVLGDTNTLAVSCTVPLNMASGQAITSASGSLAITSPQDVNVTVAALKALTVTSSSSEANSFALKVVNTTSGDDSNRRGIYVQSGFTGSPSGSNTPILMEFAAPDGTVMGSVRQTANNGLGFGTASSTLKLWTNTANLTGMSWVQQSATSLRLSGLTNTDFLSGMTFHITNGFAFDSAYDIGSTGARAGLACVTGVDSAAGSATTKLESTTGTMQLGTNDNARAWNFGTGATAVQTVRWFSHATPIHDIIFGGTASKIGLFGVTAAVQQSVSATLTNNGSGGTANVINAITAASVDNTAAKLTDTQGAINQLGIKVAAIEAALKLNGVVKT